MTRHIVLFLLAGVLFLNLPRLNAHNIPEKGLTNRTTGYFIYHGISDMITPEMSLFTKKYAISFRNNGCNLLNTRATKEHNQLIAERLTDTLETDEWIRDLPIKILGVN